MSKKLKPTDGLGPYEISKIRSAVRQVWHRSKARKECVKRCTNADGFEVCEECERVVPKVKIDHIDAVGDVDAGFIQRMFVPSSGLHGLCKKCHQQKTNRERKSKR